MKKMGTEKRSCPILEVLFGSRQSRMSGRWCEGGFEGGFNDETNFSLKL